MTTRGRTPDGTVRADLSRLGKETRRGLAAYLVFMVTTGVAAAVLTAVLILLVVWPLSLLPGPSSAGPAIALVLPASLAIAYLVTRRWFGPDGGLTPARARPAEGRRRIDAPDPSSAAGPAGGTTQLPDLPAASPAARRGAEVWLAQANFPVTVGPVWTLVAKAPRTAFVLAGAGGVLVLLLAVALGPGFAPLSPAHLVNLALVVLVCGVRLVRVGGPLRRQQGPARLVLDRQAMSVIAERMTTRIPWADVEWVGVQVKVPPRPGTPTLVAGLVPGAPTPPQGKRYNPYLSPWYEPHPRWYPHLGVVRVFDLALLAADVSELAAAVDRFSGGKWRGDNNHRLVH